MSTHDNAYWLQKLRRSTKLAIVASFVLVLLLIAIGSWASRYLSHWLLQYKLSVHKIELQANRGKLTVHQVLDEDQQRVRVIVSVTDEKNKPLTNLSARELLLHQDKVKREDFRLEPVGDTPISVLLALDVSASMGRPKRKFAYTQKAAKAFIDLAKNAEIGLLTFGTKVTQVTPFTSDKKVLKEAVANLKTIGTTALFECIEQAGMAMRQRKGRKAIVILTDGYNTQKGVSQGEAIGTCKGAGVPVFCVGLGHEIDRQVLSNVARKTGGFFFLAPTPAELKDLYVDIASRLGNQVAVVFTSHVVPKSAKWLWLGLTALVILLGLIIFFLLRGSFARPSFIVLSGKNEGQRLKFPRRAVFTVGRAKSCSVVLGYEDAVAEEHFTLERKEWGLYELVLCKEAKQLLVNGKATERTMLRNGDIVKIGRLRLMLFIYGLDTSKPTKEDGREVSLTKATKAVWLQPIDEKLPTLPLLGKQEVEVGRSRDCDLFLNNPKIAKRHCRLSCVDDQWTIEHLASSYETYVGEESISKPVKLADGNHIKFADVEYVFSKSAPTMDTSPSEGDGAGFCTQCGKQLRQTSKFCPGCGVKVDK